ncbi:hypothetical protein OHA21_05090 [Actinoplanes sp. NBC_00393]
MRRLAFALCGDWHTADDLVQVTFVKLYPRWAKIRDGQIDAYVRRVLVNTLPESPAEEPLGKGRRRPARLPRSRAGATRRPAARPGRLSTRRRTARLRRPSRAAGPPRRPPMSARTAIGSGSRPSRRIMRRRGSAAIWPRRCRRCCPGSPITR